MSSIMSESHETESAGSVMIYCADITGHRHLHSAYFIRFFSDHGYTVYFCFAGRQSRLRSRGRFIYESFESPYLEALKGNPRVHFIDICRELNVVNNELDFILELQRRLKPTVSLFIDGDTLKFMFLKQLLPWQKRLAGANFCITCLSEFLYLPVGKFQALKELRLFIYFFFFKRHRFVQRIIFVEKFPLLNKLFFRCLCRFNLLTAAFCPDARLVEKIKNRRVLFLPELITGDLEGKISEKETSFYTRVKSQYQDFLNRNRDKQVLLMFGDLENRKGFDLLLQLAANEPGCVCARFGRTKGGYTSNWPAIISKEKLLVEDRLFEVDTYIESKELVDFIFSTVRFVILPYRNYYRTSGVMIEVLRRGLPVLTPDKGVMAYIVKHHGVGGVFRDGNLTELREAFAGFKQDYIRYLKNIEKFNLIYSKENTEEILSLMLEKQK